MRPYLRVANVLDGRIDWSDIMSINVPASEHDRCALHDGDILINKGNSMNLVGRGAIYRSLPQYPSCYFQDHLLRFRAGDGVAPELAHAYFQHLFYTLQFTRIAVASTSIATIPAELFENLPFPVPPRSEQQGMVEQFVSLSSAMERLEERHGHTALIKSQFSRECFGG